MVQAVRPCVPRPSSIALLVCEVWLMLRLSAVQVVVAGSQDTFEIFVWSVKTGRLLEVPSLPFTFPPRCFEPLFTALFCSYSIQCAMRQGDLDGDAPHHDMVMLAEHESALMRLLCTQVLSGHEGPVAGLAFSPVGPLLASASWDHTLRTWDVFAGKGEPEC